MSEPESAMQIVDLTKFYWAAGALIVMNFGTIISILYSVLRATWWISKLDSRVTSNRKDVDAAHSAIRAINGKN